MSNTPLTVTTATEVGQVAAAINEVNALIAATQAAIASGAPIYQISVNLQGQPTPLNSNYVMAVADTATILNAFLTIMQNNLTALNTQLASF
jgi:hypothetical protein